MGLISKQYTSHGGQVRILNSSPTQAISLSQQTHVPPQKLYGTQFQSQTHLYQSANMSSINNINNNNNSTMTGNQHQTQLPMQTMFTQMPGSQYYQTNPNGQQAIVGTQTASRQGSLLSQLRSWQRSRKLRSLNKQQKEQQFQQQHQKHHQNQIVNPMTNLCYQSMNPLRSKDLDRTYKSSSSELISLEACSITSGSSSRSSITDTTQGVSPVVSFRNQGDGQIAMHLPGSPGTGSRLIHLNESQLYALQAHFIKNAQEVTENCYATLEGPQQMMAQNAKDDPTLRREPWFYGAISREKAVETIICCPTGSFVVRTSGTNMACFALTMRVPHDYNHLGVSHYLILCEDGKFKIKGFTKEFDTLTSLIIHHSIMKEQLPCTLRLQLDNGQNRSLHSQTHSSGIHTGMKSHYRSSPSLVYHSNNLNNNNNNNNNNNIGDSNKYGGFYGTGNSGARSMLRLNNNNSDGENDDCGPVYNDVDSGDGDEELMVDIDEDPTYQKILDNFRKSMAACS